MINKALPLEPDFQDESGLENAVARAIEAITRRAKVQALVLQQFGLDIVVFLRGNDTTRVRLFEIKSHAVNHGRCGLGDSRGGGNQIRLLFDKANDTLRSNAELKILDPAVRWILGDRSKRIGSPRYVFFSCEQAGLAASNGIRPDKQNNFRLSAFKDQWIEWPVLLRSICQFMGIHPGALSSQPFRLRNASVGGSGLMPGLDEVDWGRLRDLAYRRDQ